MPLTLYVLTDRRGGCRVEVEGRPIWDAGLGLRCAEDVALRYLLDADEEGDILVRDAYDRVRSYRHVTPQVRSGSTAGLTHVVSQPEDRT